MRKIAGTESQSINKFSTKIWTEGMYYWFRMFAYVIGPAYEDGRIFDFQRGPVLHYYEIKALFRPVFHL